MDYYLAILIIGRTESSTVHNRERLLYIISSNTVRCFISRDSKSIELYINHSHSGTMTINYH